MVEKSYGRTASGREITEAMIEEFVAEAEAGFDVEVLLARRALRRRPPIADGLTQPGSD